MTDRKEDKRFSFGKNWRRFLEHVSEERISTAERHLSKVLATHISGKTFLDAGCGSGLFSLAAHNLGANVRAFDLDPDSVRCTELLFRKFSKSDDGTDRGNIDVGRGSVLDPAFLSDCGTFDIVYSFGVLHHTGDMWKAFSNVATLPKDGGILYIAIYNKKRTAYVWRSVKILYNKGMLGRFLTRCLSYPWFISKDILYSIRRWRNIFLEAKRTRGMSYFTDLEDWIGGYPYEFASPDEIVDFFCRRGFLLKYLKTTSSVGNNEFTFVKLGSSRS